jgi:5-methylcytosine-specific restriction endonuclease McrA
VTKKVKQLRKRKQPVQRVHRTEPQRRKIAKKQNWLCAGEQCREAQPNQELEEYDIDHIIPLHLGGTEGLDNLQALCPGCHRRKTDQERIDVLMSSNVS